LSIREGCHLETMWLPSHIWNTEVEVDWRCRIFACTSETIRKRIDRRSLNVILCCADYLFHCYSSSTTTSKWY
jgi:hypothetical protein